jgi:hypothetical protein
MEFGLFLDTDFEQGAGTGVTWAQYLMDGLLTVRTLVFSRKGLREMSNIV